MTRLFLAVALSTMTSLFGCAVQAGDETPAATDETTDTQAQELQPGTGSTARLEQFEAPEGARQLNRGFRGRGDRVQWQGSLCDGVEAASSELCRFHVPQVAPRRQ